MTGQARPFAPQRFCFTDENAKQMIEHRLEHSGEYVRHLPADGPPQWVVMNYQHIPARSEPGEGYIIPSTTPKLWGLVDHFECAPANRHSKRGGEYSGSQFIVRGITYNAKSVDINHRGGLCVEIARDAKCEGPDPAFFEEVKGLLCYDAHPCAAT